MESRVQWEREGEGRREGEGGREGEGERERERGGGGRKNFFYTIANSVSHTNVQLLFE